MDRLDTASALVQTRILVCLPMGVVWMRRGAPATIVVRRRCRADSEDGFPVQPVLSRCGWICTRPAHNGHNSTLIGGSTAQWNGSVVRLRYRAAVVQIPSTVFLMHCVKNVHADDTTQLPQVQASYLCNRGGRPGFPPDSLLSMLKVFGIMKRSGRSALSCQRVW